MKLDPKLVLEGGYTFESGVACAQQLLERPPAARPTAVFAGNDEMAVGVYQAARRAGFGVPEDLSIVGFDDIPMASRIWPPLTTVRLPIREMGKAAAALLIAPEPAERTAPVAFQPEIVVRQSTAPLPRKSGTSPVFNKTYHATHPEYGGGRQPTLASATSSTTSSRASGRLNYSHNERFVIGGALPVRCCASRCPRRPSRGGALPGASRTGRRERRCGGGRVTRRRRPSLLAPRDGLYVPRERAECHVRIGRAERAGEVLPGLHARARAFRADQDIDRRGRAAERGARETSNERTIYQYIVPASASLRSCCSG